MLNRDTEANSITPDTRRRKRLNRIAGCLFILAIITLVLLDEESTGESVVPVAVPNPTVSYVNVETASYAAVVEAMAEVNPRYQSTIRSRVRGEVIELNEDFIAGNTVSKGDLLLQVEDSTYRAAVANAQNSLSQARVAYLTEERQAAQALRNWQRSGIKTEPNSPLTLHEPQLRAARAELKAAEAELKRVQVDFSYTQIKAPFDGVIVDRAINPGESIEPGQELGTVLATGVVDITVRLNERQWSLLSENWRGAAAILVKPGSGISWTARIREDGKLIEPQTRMRRLYLELDADKNPENRLLPGSYVHVRLPGKTLSGLLKIPESAYTREARIWYLDESDRLDSFKTDMLFTSKGYVFVAHPGMVGEKLRVVLYPQAGFNRGQIVTPQMSAELLAGGN